VSEINDPEVVAEVSALHHEYEAALVGNDVAVLERMFWQSPDSVRFGIREALYGSEEIGAFRRGRPNIDLSRTVTRLKVVTFGRDMAISTIEFDRKAFGAMRQGRQSQVWRRLAEGWRIVSAHVSFTFEDATVDQLAGLVGLPIPDAYRAGVEINLARARGIAQAVLDFPLPETVESAPVFQP
jgi:hypothetical protein